MKKAVAFLLVFLIFVAPMTTFVKADVVIGDNDETIINENATILGRKLALMESLSDLALSGVTEFTISNTNDVDSYLDYLWEELGSAIDSLQDGTGFEQISNELKSKYFTNLVQYKDYITNRGSYLSQLLPSGNPTTTLLSTFFANNIYGKQTTKHYDLALDMFRSLSALNRDNSPQTHLPENYEWLDICGTYKFGYEQILFDQLPMYLSKYDTSTPITPVYTVDNYSYYVALNNQSFNNNITSSNTYNTFGNVFVYGILDINIVTNQNITNRYDIICSHSPYVANTYYKYPNGYVNLLKGLYFNTSTNYFIPASGMSQNNEYSLIDNLYFTGFDNAINYVYNHFRHVNIYVDNVLWVSADGNIETRPTLDIDGYLKIYGNNQPQQYQLQPNTKIDYDQLYQVIYNAIRDNLPISQGDINYYDSHDTIYSPTIINNYGEEEGDENDLIDTILDYAVIPKFDTAIAQPMRQALTNGVVIMNTSITDVIPNEILLILGACFFLLLFAVVINRMIK